MSVKRKIISAILVIFFVIGGLFFLGKTGFNILSAMRASVGGEGLWAKGQKDATYHLSQYIFTKKQENYQLFLDSLKVPLGDTVARIELEKTTPAYEVVIQGFIEGGNHPDDIPAIISLYEMFKDNEYIRKAIEQWKAGDRLINELLQVGEEIHHHITTDKLNTDQTALSLAKIDTLQKKLNETEFQFSYNVSKASRWTENLFLISIIIFSVSGSIVCMIMFRLISDIISDLNDKKVQLEKQMAQEKIIREKLKDNEERLKETQNIARLGSWELDVPNNKIWWSEETYRIFGFTKGDGIAFEEFTQSIHPEDKKNVTDLISQAIQQATPLALDYRIILPSGDIRYLHEESRTIYDEAHEKVAKRVGSVQDITKQRLIEKERENLIKKLEKSFEEIQILRGILPICSYCKNIRNDKGYYEQIENYIHKHSGVKFTHTICPSCMKIQFPEEYQALEKDKSDS